MRVTFPTWVATGALACGIIATGCSQSPVAPSASPTVTAPTVTGGASGSAAMSEASLTPAELEARGWDCRQSPINPARHSCSRPNQLHPFSIPGPPPPADRPASITVLVFDNGVFFATDLLIRSDLYNGQPCSSTGDAYRLIARIGYYECLHQSQAN